MNITSTSPRAMANSRLSEPRTLVIGALVGIALLYVFVQAVLLRKIEMPLPIFCVISLILAALVAGRPVGGWRWVPLLGTAWSTILLLGGLQRTLTHLSQPESTMQFAAQLLMLGLLATGFVGGIGTTVQNYRQPVNQRRLPRWVPWSYVALAGLIVGAVSVAAIPRTGGVQVAPEVMAQLPLVPLDVFGGGEIRVRAGELTALRLDNSDAASHSFDVDELNVHVVMPANSESLALFTAQEPGVYTFYCAPHYDKTTGRGMHGTLIVEP